MATTSFTEDDQRFLDAFEGCFLPRSCWTHQAHVRMAWLMLERIGSFAAALDRIRESIQRYNSSIGSDGYHETVTVAYTRIIEYRRLLDPTVTNFDAFVANNADLVDRDEAAILVHYSKVTLGLAEARKVFILPDLKPLPAIGSLTVASNDDA